MKKIYQNPAIKIIKVQPASMIATSQIDTGDYAGGEIQSRRGGSFLEDENEDNGDY